MSTFISGTTDTQQDLHPYQPDYSFLTKVYNTKQAEYDHGFNIVSNLYNSKLNNPLTNAENETQRKEIFKKIQNSLKSTAAVDLSDPSVVNDAVKLMDPLSKDKEIAYDMYATSYINKQMETADSYKNSSDPEKRKLYSDIAVQDINFAREDLKNAKRGDGSIMQVQPRDFVEFEDYNAYLNKQQKEAGLKIVTTETKNGYIKEVTNGRDAAQPFALWAKQQLGTRFDRQFDVTGRVQSENAIRGTMKEKGVSREEAQKIVAQPLVNQAIKDKTDEVDLISGHIKNLDNTLSAIKKYYPKGIPSSNTELLEKQKALLKTKDYYTSELENANTELTTYKDKGLEAVSSNLFGIYRGEAKNSATKGWGTAAAMATSEVHLKPDEVVLKQWQLASEEKRHYQTLSQAYRIHQEDMANSNEKFNLEYKLKLAEHNLNKKIAKGKGEISDSEVIGTSTGKDSRSAIDIVQSTLNDVQSQMENSTYSAVSGLVNLAYENNDKVVYSPIFEKVRAIAGGSQIKLTDDEKQKLKVFSDKIGAKYEDIMDNVSAQAMNNQLIGNIYKYASNQLKNLSPIDKRSEILKNRMQFQNVATGMKTYIDQYRNLMTNQKRIANMVIGTDGQIKSQYDGAEIKGYMDDGTPIISFDNLKGPAEEIAVKKNMLSTPLGEDFKVGQMYNSSVYSVASPETGLWYALRSSLSDPKSATKFLEGDASDVKALKLLSPDVIAKLAGKKVIITPNPLTKELTVEMNIDPASPEFKSKEESGVRKGGTFKFTIPYSTVENSRGQFGDEIVNIIHGNTAGNSTYGILAPFAGDPFTTVESPGNYTHSGINYTVSGATEGGAYGLLVNFNTLNPQTGVVTDRPYFLPVPDKKDPSRYEEINSIINNVINDYQNSITIHENHKNSGEPVPGTLYH